MDNSYDTLLKKLEIKCDKLMKNAKKELNDYAMDLIREYKENSIDENSNDTDELSFINDTINTILEELDSDILEIDDLEDNDLDNLSPIDGVDIDNDLGIEVDINDYDNYEEDSLSKIEEGYKSRIKDIDLLDCSLELKNELKSECTREYKVLIIDRIRVIMNNPTLYVSDDLYDVIIAGKSMVIKNNDGSFSKSRRAYRDDEIADVISTFNNSFKNNRKSTLGSINSRNMEEDINYLEEIKNKVKEILGDEELDISDEFCLYVGSGLDELGVRRPYYDDEIISVFYTFDTDKNKSI